MKGPTSGMAADPTEPGRPRIRRRALPPRAPTAAPTRRFRPRRAPRTTAGPRGTRPSPRRLHASATDRSDRHRPGVHLPLVAAAVHGGDAAPDEAGPPAHAPRVVGELADLQRPE